MKENNKYLLHRIVFGAAVAALVFVGTFFFKIPTPVGYIHLGDGFIYAASVILPLPVAAISAAVGGGLSDLLSGYPLWIAPTIVIKALSTLLFRRKAPRLLCGRNLLALGFGIVCNVGGYYLFGSAIQGNFTTCLVEIPLNLLQETAGCAIFLVFAGILDANPKLRGFFSSKVN